MCACTHGYTCSPCEARKNRTPEEKAAREELVRLARTTMENLRESRYQATRIDNAVDASWELNR